MAYTDNAAMKITDNLASNDGAPATCIAIEAVAPKWLFYTGLLGMFPALVTGVG